MKAAFTLWAAIVLMGLSVAAAAVMATRPVPTADGRPVPASARTMLADPDFYAGRLVAVPASQWMTGADGASLEYREEFPGPPLCVCQFDGPLPDPRPRSVVGRCLGVKGGVVVIVNCRPGAAGVP